MTPLTKTKVAIAQIDEYKQMLNQFLDNQSMTATESVIEEENSEVESKDKSLIDISEE
jgi:hypothetical protein